jgi:hypothetical protein
MRTMAETLRFLAAINQPSIDGINTLFASKAARERGRKLTISGVDGQAVRGYPSCPDIPERVSWLSGRPQSLAFEGSSDCNRQRRNAPPATALMAAHKFGSRNLPGLIPKVIRRAIDTSPKTDDGPQLSISRSRR